MIKRRNQKRSNFSARYEALENRKVLASVVLDAGVLSIFGDSGDNSAHVSFVEERPSEVRVVLDGETQFFERSSVESLRFIGASGDDWFRNRTETTSRAWGGPGDDFWGGGTGFDRLVGQGGDDHIIGFGGNDVLLGVDGNDRLVGSDGDDIIWGCEYSQLLDQSEACHVGPRKIIDS